MNPKELRIFGLKTTEGKTPVRGRVSRGTPIDTYPPKAEPAIVSNRVITDTPVREKKLAPPPTPEEVKAANAGKLAPKGLLKFALDTAKKHPVITAGVTLAAIAGGFAAVEAAQGNIPGIHRSINKESLPSHFDTTATKGVVVPNNILVVPTEVFNKAPSVDAEGKPIFNFPWDPNHPIAIEYSKNAVGDKEIAWLKSGGLANAEDYRGYQSGFYSDNSLPVGYEFPTIYPGSRLFFVSNPYNKDIIEGAKIEFTAPNGILYAINVNIVDDSGGVEKNLPILPLIDAPLIGDDNRQGKDWEKGTLVSENVTKTFRVLKEGKLKIGIGGRKNESLLQKDYVPGDLNFKTGVDTTGTPKVLVSDSK